MKFRILLIFMSFFLTACIDVEVCDNSYDSELIAIFKTMKEDVATDTSIAALSLYGIREGLSDSLLYEEKSTGGFVVPLDPTHGYSRFVLQINGQMDTLVIPYHHELYLISYNCGFGNLFTLEDHITSSTGIIKGDTILSDMIDAEYETNEVHIWLYL